MRRWLRQRTATCFAAPLHVLVSLRQRPRDCGRRAPTNERSEWRDRSRWSRRRVSFSARSPLVAAAVFRGELVDQGHDAIGLFRRDAGELEEVLALEVDDVVERAIAGF